MKLSTLLIAFLLVEGLSTVSAQTLSTGAVITWEDNAFDFGEIIAGETFQRRKVARVGLR